MPLYKGADPTVILVNEMEDLRGSWRYNLLYQDRETTIDNIIESAAIQVQLDTQYEEHYRESNCYPISKKSRVKLQGSELSAGESIPPKQPSDGSFTDNTAKFPRAPTAQERECTFCSSGSKTCPNCKKEGEVTCPDCHKKRSGKCSKCKGRGEVDCSKCGGDGNCNKCDGRGDVRCGTCRGDKHCPRCDGSGFTGSGDNRSKCRKCNGNGRCPKCKGDGKVRCSRCKGNGDCSRCHGRGRVECSKCNGTGTCQKCGGRGTLKCPTCQRSGRVKCPICKGDAKVFLYTSDVYDYQHVTDTEEVFPESFDRDRVNLESINEIKLRKLEEDDFQQRVGLMNRYITNEMGKARSAHQRLKTTAEGREVDKGHRKKDKRVQKKVLSSAEKEIKSSWSSTRSDSYSAEYKTSCVRSKKHPTAYKKILFQRSTYEAYPVSMVKFRIEDDQREMYAAGTKEDYDVSVPLADRSVGKISALTGSVLSAGGAGYVYMTETSLQTASLSLGHIPLTGVAAGLAGIFLAAFLYMGYSTMKTTDPSLVTVVGEDDSLNTTLLSVLGNTVSYEDEGVVKDQVYTKISEKNMEDLTLGSSLSYSIEFSNGELVRVISLSTASYESMDEDTEELIEKSDGMICVAENGELPGKLETLTEEFEGNVSIVGETAETTNGEYETYEIPIEDLQDEYLRGDSEKYSKTIECVKTTMSEEG